MVLGPLETKVSSLRSILRDMAPVLVAYSGGVDSATLLDVSRDELGCEEVLAVTACGDVHTLEETSVAVESAARMGVAHLVIDTHELEVPGFADNPPERCYLCKASLYARLLEVAQDNGMKTVVDGANSDDRGDYRPGMKAAGELGVRSPLAEAGLTKAEVRVLARERGLGEWDKPSSPCLASRFPYGERITAEGLKMVAEAECYLRGLGFETLRVRHHGDVARIELAQSEMARVVEVGDHPGGAGESMRRGIVDHLRRLGYRFVTLDLQGFRSGSLNESLVLTPGQEERL